MPAFAIELFDSRELSTGVNPYAIFRYAVHEAADEQVARQAAEAASDPFYDIYGRGLYIARERINVTRLGETLWHAEVFYGGVNPANQMVLAFDTSGGTQHVTHSRKTLGRYGAPGTTAPDFTLDSAVRAKLGDRFAISAAQRHPLCQGSRAPSA